MEELLKNNFFLIQLCSCLFMTGLIWTIQLVHYPSFDFVEKNIFSKFHDFHSNRITLIVGPVMLLELVSAIFLYNENGWLLNLTSVIFVWAITAFVSIPLHKKLKTQQTPQLIQKLVLSNWLRTVTWSLRSIALITALSQYSKN